jgi:hypothetical protein
MAGAVFPACRNPLAQLQQPSGGGGIKAGGVAGLLLRQTRTKAKPQRAMLADCLFDFGNEVNYEQPTDPISSRDHDG